MDVGKTRLLTEKQFPFLVNNYQVTLPPPSYTKQVQYAVCVHCVVDIFCILVYLSEIETITCYSHVSMQLVCACIMVGIANCKLQKMKLHKKNCVVSFSGSLNM